MSRGALYTSTNAVFVYAVFVHAVFVHAQFYQTRQENQSRKKRKYKNTDCCMNIASQQLTFSETRIGLLFTVGSPQQKETALRMSVTGFSAHTTNK